MRLLPVLLAALPTVAAAESYVPEVTTEPVDLLVVIDSAPAAAGARAALAEAIGGFIDQLEARFPGDYGDALSLHVGFVTGDLGAGDACPAGDGARLQIASDSCLAAGALPWVIAETDTWGDTTRNFDGEVAAAVRCAMPVTLDGCRFQQPLRAAVTALDGSVTANAGFLRDQAILAVLFVSTQDDCSAPDGDFFAPDATGPATPRRCAEEGWTCAPPIDGTPQVHAGCTAREDSPWLEHPGDVVTALSQAKSDPRRVVVGVVRGAAAPVITDGELVPSCGAGTDRAATPGLRLDAVAAGFPGRNVVASVCDDLAGALDTVGATIEAATQGDPAEPPPDYEGPVCDGGEGGAPMAEGSRGGCDAGGGRAGAGLLVLIGAALAGRRRR